MNDIAKAILEKNPALAVLAQIDNGGLVSELAHELKTLVQASTNTGKKGELTLKIEVKPKGANKLEINGEVKPKPAKQTRTATTFFTDHKLNLLRTDPNQGEIDFKAASGGAN